MSEGTKRVPDAEAFFGEFPNDEEFALILDHLAAFARDRKFAKRQGGILDWPEPLPPGSSFPDVPTP